MGIQLFEGLSLLHDLRIAHGDILLQNTVVNAFYSFTNSSCRRSKSTLRHPPDALYAFIDYDKARIFPLDTDIDTLVVDRAPSYGMLCGGVASGRGNPFFDDVTCLATSLELFLRVIKFDELGARRDVTGKFFDTILRDRAQRSARWAMEQIVAVRDSLTTAQLRSRLRETPWTFTMPDDPSPTPSASSAGPPEPLDDPAPQTGLANGAGPESAKA